MFSFFQDPETKEYWLKVQEIENYDRKRRQKLKLTGRK